MFIKYVISILYANNDYFDIINGKHPELGNDLARVKATSDGIIHAMISNRDTASKYFKWQGRLFYSGIILFIVWHITEMYFKSEVLP